MSLLIAAAIVAERSDVQPNEGAAAIIRCFDDRPIVAIGEAHGVKQAGEFYVSLVQDPTFQSRVNDVLIEFASQLSQPILDRYVNGKEVSQSELQQIWRNTTKVFSWESPIYPRLLAAIREVNRGLPPTRRMRVLAGDSPIDWQKIHTHQQWAAYQPNDQSFASVLTKEVLDKKRRALVILGGNHVARTSDPLHTNPNTTTLIERIYPHSVYVVLLSSGNPGRLASGKPPILVPTPVAAKVGDFGDALLYLGDSFTAADPDWASYAKDPDYMKELDRRARIEWGCAFDLRRFKLGRRPCASN